MSNLLFNIRFGSRHFQMNREFKMSFEVNPFWIINKPEKWFQIYSAFGKHY